MRIDDKNVKLRTVCFASAPGHTGRGRPGFRTVWNRKRGATVWTKDGTGATKSSAQMAEALRYFATAGRYALDLDYADGGIARVTERAGYVAPPMGPAPRYAYRCAGCGAVVMRRRRANEGVPVWCGGRRCESTFTVRLTNAGETERDIERLFALLPGVDVRAIRVPQQ